MLNYESQINFKHWFEVREQPFLFKANFQRNLHYET